MASDLLSIAKSGAHAARVALDVTAQNIANASTEGYVRRTARMTEVASSGGIRRIGDVSLSGSRLAAVVRNADMFRQSEVRRTGADAARAGAEVTGLENIAAAVEQSNVYPSIVNFEGSLQRLVADPVDPGLRAAVVEDARTMVRTFNISSDALDAAGTGLRFEASDNVTQVNRLGAELARVNLRLARASDASSDQSTLLDQRDNILQSLSTFSDISTTIGADQSVEVRLGGANGPQLVKAGNSATLNMATATDGTISFDVNGTAVALSGGALAGRGLALTKLADIHDGLDKIAKSVIDTVNAALAKGVAPNGSAGQPMFSGTTAGDMALAFENGQLIATAPPVSVDADGNAIAATPDPVTGVVPGANSRDPGNLEKLRSALSGSNPAGETDRLIFDISSAVNGRTITRDALNSIADNANLALQAQAGVNLDDEAVNLVRYQQAFQASGKVMQVASTLFDTLLGIR